MFLHLVTWTNMGINHRREFSNHDEALGFKWHLEGGDNTKVELRSFLKIK